MALMVQYWSRQTRALPFGVHGQVRGHRWSAGKQIIKVISEDKVNGDHQYHPSTLAEVSL